MKIENIALSKIKANPNNPRVIRDEKFEKLKKSITDFPKMLELRPIVVDNDFMVLGGNMRLKACQALGLKEVPIIKVDNLTEEQKKEFIIKDNVGFGEWDWDVLANEWDEGRLGEWGLDVLPRFDFSEKNEEIDIERFENEMTIKLKYSESDYNLVKEQLSKIASTPEMAIYKLLGNA